MKPSLQALLHWAIDYAGTYPPASLTLEQAFANYRACYAESLSRGALCRRFVVPALRLGELAALYRATTAGEESHFRARLELCIVVPEADTTEALLSNFDQALAVVHEFRELWAIEAWELRWPADRVQTLDFGSLATVVQLVAERVASSGATPLSGLYFELPSSAVPTPTPVRPEVLARFVRILAEFNASEEAWLRKAGLKIRTGGATAGAFPSSAALAAAIFTCREAQLFWKATAGLHQPLRHFDPTVSATAHGFINVLTAAVLSHVYPLDPAQIETILDDTDPAHFSFDDTGLRWRDRAATIEQIRDARQHAMRSFGSCSLDEPRDGLRALGWL